jgi:hypothetical protein
MIAMIRTGHTRLGVDDYQLSLAHDLLSRDRRIQS